MSLPRPSPPLLLLGLLALGLPCALAAGDADVPAAVQAELLAKVAAYDRNLAARAGEQVRTLVVAKVGDAASARLAAQLKDALAGKSAIAGLPHAEETVAFESAAALASAVRQRRAAIVYLSSGFADAELEAIAAALDGVDVLTAGSASYVRKGVVLGFDLVSGKPKLVVDLPRANRQRVALSANVLRLMTVYQ